MRRLARYAVNSFIIMSLLLCVATAVIWVRSYWLTDTVRWKNLGGWRAVRSATGSVEVGLMLVDPSEIPAITYRGPQYERDRPRPPFNWLMILGGSSGDTLTNLEWGGFAWNERRNVNRGIVHGRAVVPFWSIWIATAVLPLGWATARLRARVRHRRQRGHCPACGYDLRATPDRCPECGKTTVESTG